MIHEQAKEAINEARYTGYITKFHFQQDDFAIATFQTENNRLIRIKGNFYGVDVKERITVFGLWETHSKYGNQLMVHYWERPIPKTKDQIIAYLSSSLVKNCGKKYAEKIVEALGEQAIELINEHGEDVLLGIRGIGRKRASDIAESIRKTFEIQKIVRELQPYGITADIAIKAYKYLGLDTVEKLKKNPYLLVDLNIMSFPKADEIGRNMGIMPLSAFRIDCCVAYFLNQLCYAQGHCFVHEDELFNVVLMALNSNVQDQHFLITMEELKQSIYRLEGQKIIIENDCVYPKKLYMAEDEFAKKISQIYQNRRKKQEIPSTHIDKLISEYQRKNGILLTETQREAIRLIFKENVLVLTGGPGTGKTTIVKGVIDVFKKVHPKASIGLAAPTGRASRRLSEVAKMEATTIHKMIGYRQGETPLYCDEYKLKHELIIVDEMSMTDVYLAYLLLDAVQNDATVLFVGDVDQLPSVGPGNVLKDLIEAGLPTVRLTEIFRQAKESLIVVNAHRINEGKQIMIDNSRNDFYFIQNNHLESIAELTVLSVTRFLKLGYSLSDILVLSPIKKGIVGKEELNERIRDRVNPPCEGKSEIKIGSRIFRDGDKVIQTVNNDEKNVSNGDIGIIVQIDTEKEKVIVDYSGIKVTYVKDEMDQIELAFCITVHKSQGSESPIVIMPIAFCQGRLLIRNLIYTGLTRAKEKMVFIGQLNALGAAISNNKIAIRNSRLSEKIKGYIEYSNRLKQEMTINQ